MVPARTIMFVVAYLLLLWIWNQLLATTLFHKQPALTTSEILDPATRMHSPLTSPPAASTATKREAASMNVDSAVVASPPPSQVRREAVIPAQQKNSCNVSQEHLELDGAVVMDGIGKRGLSLSADDCCAKCAAVRGCNVWVACMQEASCGHQCWLKWTPTPASPSWRGKGSGVPWVSGVLHKDVPEMVPDLTDAELAPISAVALRTPQGDIKIRLVPEWHLPSVRWVQRVAATDSCTVRCVLYRGEPRFLLQGGMPSVIAPNTLTQNGPKGSAMRRGDVAWAGGGSGPDLFITMGNTPGFGGQHTMWGQVLDKDSMDLAEKLVFGKPEANYKPGQMRLLEDPIPFTVVPLRGVTNASAPARRLLSASSLAG